jgi:hypothetical protein
VDKEIPLKFLEADEGAAELEPVPAPFDVEEKSAEVNLKILVRQLLEILTRELLNRNLCLLLLRLKRRK